MAIAILGSLSCLNSRESESLDEAKRTVLLGLVFLLCLVLAYVENMSFFNYLEDVFFESALGCFACVCSQCSGGFAYSAWNDVLCWGCLNLLA